MMINQVSRRTLLAGTAVMLAAPALIGGSRANAATRLTLGHGAAPGNPRTVAAAEFARLVESKTGGQVTINVAGSEQLGNDVAMLTSLRTGALDLSANSQGAASALVPELSALGLPFLFSDAEEAVKVLQGPAGRELSAKFQSLGIVVLDWWDNGIRQVSNSKKPVETPEDLQGMKIRTPADPVTIDIFRAMGAATEQISFSELYVALQQGVVDGQENPLANILSAKLYEVTPYISMTAHKWESTPFLLSQIGASKLSTAQREAVNQAAIEAGKMQRRLMAESGTGDLEKLKAFPDVKVNTVDRAPFKKATDSVIAAWEKKPFGPFVKQIVEAARS